MSVKAILTVLECARLGYETTQGLDALAEKEITALKNACRTLAVNGVLTAIEDKGFKDECESVAVLKAIAKEAE